MPTQPVPNLDVRDALAAERTFLAWIRTGLALMGFGFVVARFGLFLQQFDLMQRLPANQSFGFSLWFGTALIAVGVVVNILSAVIHIRLMRQLREGANFQSRPSLLAVALACFLGLVGLVMAAYLIKIRASDPAHPSSTQVLPMMPAPLPGIAVNAISFSGKSIHAGHVGKVPRSR